METKKEMKIWKVLTGVLAVLLFLSIMTNGFNITAGNSADVSDTTAVAKCLTEKGVVMYGTEWCSHCQNQKKMFGDDFQYVTFVDCDAEKDKCVGAGVEGFPTWVINGKNYPGEQALTNLASLAGC